jgi:hypothetical protein
MPSLRDKVPDGVLCTTRTSATAAGFVRSSQLSSSRPGQVVRPVRESGMGRPSQHNSHPGRPPCWVITLAFGLIGGHFSIGWLQPPTPTLQTQRRAFRPPITSCLHKHKYTSENFYFPLNLTLVFLFLSKFENYSYWECRLFI